jgi:hypothetical protein
MLDDQVIRTSRGIADTDKNVTGIRSNLLGYELDQEIYVNR